MPRRARLVYPDVTMHVVQRGNNHGQCFFAKADYRVLPQILGMLADRFDCALHAYCLMTNHFHLLLTPGTQDACGPLMKGLSQRYVQYVNRRYKRSGTLWEGRYRSCLAQSARYVLACYRYIETNPVRARMVERAKDYAWSSHRSNALYQHDALLAPHPEYVALGPDDATRKAMYRALFADELEPSMVRGIREATHGGHALGSEAFLQGISRIAGRPVAAGRPGRPSNGRF
jgi:putative transposase